MRSFERYVCAGDLGPARLIRIPGSGHSVYFERPDEFNRVIENFLRETPGELIDRERDRMGSPLLDAPWSVPSRVTFSPKISLTTTLLN